MKELLAILQAVGRAREMLSCHHAAGERFPETTLVELTDLLCSDELKCALEKVQANVGSPPLIPEDAPLKNAPIEG